MTRRTLVPIWILALLFVSAGAHAATISMVPAATTVGLTGSVDVDLNISGLGNLAPDSLGVFDIDLGYDAGIVSLDSVSFGSSLSVAFPSVQILTPSAGSVNIFELSLDSAADLHANQAGSFTIATLTFSRVAAGTTTLVASVNALGDALGAPLAFNVAPGTRITAAIPEPSAALLWVTGLVVLRNRLRARR